MVCVCITLTAIRAVLANADNSRSGAFRANDRKNVLSFARTLPNTNKKIRKSYSMLRSGPFVVRRDDHERLIYNVHYDVPMKLSSSCDKSDLRRLVIHS